MLLKTQPSKNVMELRLESLWQHSQDILKLWLFARKNKAEPFYDIRVYLDAESELQRNF